MLTKYIESLKNMSDEELKEKFIHYFGIEKWNHEEQLGKLFPLTLKICEDLGIDPIPVVVESIPDDSRYYVQEDYIAISDKYIMDDLEMFKCAIHELRHKYQLHCVFTNNTKEPLMLEWKEELSIDYNNLDPSIQLCTLLELDAYGYQKKMLKKLFDIDWHYPDDMYDEAVSLYVKKYLS